MSEKKLLGELIYAARKQLGLSQQELADKFDTAVNRVTVGRWEKDEQRISIRNFEELISILDLNEQVAYALYYAGGKTPPERHNLPLPNRFFTGREAYLEKLRKLLEEDHIVALTGLPGIGKTQIALKYAYSHHADLYPTVLWLNAATKATLEAEFAGLTKTLELPERDEHELEQRIKAVKKWLEKHTNWLLIIDNADELPIVKPFLLSIPHGYILLTTRWQFPEEFAKQLEIEAMGPEEGRRFLSRRTDRQLNGAERDAAKRLAEALGRHTLAMEQAGAYIQQTGTSFENYLKLYEENRRDLLSQYGALGNKDSEHRLTVAATFKTSFAKAQALFPLAEDILHFCAFLFPDAIPAELFQYDEKFIRDEMAFNKGMAALLRYSLVKYNDQNKTFSLHRLVQAVAIDGMSADQQKQWRERVVRALYAAFPGFNVDNWDQTERLLAHIFECSTWTDIELVKSFGLAEMCHWVGRDHLAQGQFSEAENFLHLACSLSMHHYGTKHPTTVSAMEELGCLYLMLGKYDEAGFLCGQAFDIRTELQGMDRPGVVRDMTTLATIYFMQGMREEAASMIAQAVLLWVIRLKADPAASAFPIIPFVALLHAQGKHEQAEAWYHGALNCLEHMLGAAHPSIQELKKQHADLMQRAGHGTAPTVLEVRVYDESPVIPYPGDTL